MGSSFSRKFLLGEDASLLQSSEAKLHLIVKVWGAGKVKTESSEENKRY